MPDIAPRRVVSVSLGTSKRDKASDLTILGERFRIERRGTDGDVAAFAALFRELDGKVDALGVGGADMVVVIDDRRYPWKQIVDIAAQAKRTPVVDGSGLKHTLERETVVTLQRDGIIDFASTRVLLVAGVERFGMAQAMEKLGARVTYGDLMFGLGLPFPLRSYASVRRLGRLLLPILTRLPQTWIYPIGKQQEVRKPKWHAAFRDADLICGDWHLIRRSLPDGLQGKTILTQTIRAADLDLLRQLGVSRVITTTPVIDGETFATNVMEAVVVALLGKRPETLSEEDYWSVLRRLDWQPGVMNLEGSQAAQPTVG